MLRELNCDFFYHSLLGDVDKLQCLLENNILLPTILYLLCDDNSIGLLYFQARKVVWSWTYSKVQRIVEEVKMVLYTFSIETCNIVCVVNQYENLGFIYMRSTNQTVHWPPFGFDLKD